MTIRRFNRYELKYLLPSRQAHAVMRDLETMTLPDDHGGTRGYRVVSLYYDSPSLDCYWAKLDGLKFRRKLRLRVYPEGDINAVRRGMVEIKQRMNRTVQKRRIELAIEDAEQLCTGEFDSAGLDQLDSQVADEVQYMVRAMQLRPACLIAYHRVAFVGGLYDAGLRITFDTDLRSRMHALQVREDAGNHLFLPPDWCVMEVKANNAIPDWVTSWLARHDCQLHRVSKYCAGLERARRIRMVPFGFAPDVVRKEAVHG